MVTRGLAGFHPPFTTEAASVQLLGTLAREVPQRLVQNGSQYAYDLLEALQRADEKEDSEDFRESCLSALQALVRGCVSEHDTLHAILDAAAAQATYDPNRMEGMDDDGDEDIDDDDDDDLLDEMSDDDDLSWRVRRNACRLIDEIFTDHAHFVTSSAAYMCATLASRLNEREETVRTEALSALVHVLQVSPDAISSHSHIVPTVCAWRGSTLQLAALEAVAQMASILGPSLPMPEKALELALGAMKDAQQHGRPMAGAVLLRHLCTSVPGVVQSQAPRAAAALAAMMASTHHRTVMEALTTATSFLQYVAPSDPSCAYELCDVVGTRLAQTDTDASVRDACLVAVDVALCTLATALGPRMEQMLALVYTRLTQEMTRARCIQVVQDVMTSVSLRDVAVVQAFARECLAPLAEATRRADVGVMALHALHSIAKQLQQEAQPTVLQVLALGSPPAEAATLAPTLMLAEWAVQHDPRVARTVADTILPSLLPQLAQISSSALDALCALLTSLASAEDAIAPALVGALERAWESQGTDRSAQTPRMFARCLCAAAVASEALPSVLGRVEVLIQSPEQAPQTLGYYTVGELGRQGMLAGWPDASAIFAKAKQSDVPGRLVAMGGMLLGDAQFLSSLLHAMREGDGEAVQILREALLMAPDAQVREWAPQVWPSLTSMPLAEVAPDACADCIARIVLEDPARFAEVVPLVQASEASVRVMALNALRSMYSLDRTHTLDAMLHAHVGVFVAALGDADLRVRRAAVMALRAGINSRADLLSMYSHQILPLLYEATWEREELKRKVLMGPFTVIQDDGLDLRKNAYETLLTLMDAHWAGLHVVDMVQCVVRALKDDDSVKLLGCLMMVRLTDLAGQGLLGQVDDVVAPLQAILSRKLRDNATKQEVEKFNELIYAALRVLAHLAPCASACPALHDLLAHTRTSAHAETLLHMEEDLP